MTKLNRRFAQRVAVTAVSLVLAGAAQAVVVRGVFDPSFGPPHADLGYRGIGDFFVDNACLAANGFVWWNASCGGSLQYGQAMGLLSASVELYDARLLPGVPPTIGSPIVFQAELAEPGDDFPMWGVFIENGVVTGIDTLPIGEFTQGGSGPIAQGPVVAADDVEIYPGGFLDLYFKSGQFGGSCDLGEAFCGSNFDFSGGSASFGPADDPLTAGAFLTSTACLTGCPTVTSLGAQVTYTVVPAAIPEPGTLALLLGALGGGWFARRRRKQAA